MINHGLSGLEELHQRKDWLQKSIEETEARLNNAPEGTVRILRHGNGLQFFHRTRSEDTSGVYLPVSESSKARALIQKRYDQKVIREARKQFELLENFLDRYDPEAIKRVFEECGELRKPFIEAWELPDKEFREAWESVEYERKPFREGTAEHYTAKNERVRSKSEVLIANALFRAGLSYRYEYPLVLGGQLFHPDFTILRIRDRKTLIWEHLGMLDDPEYRNQALEKILFYERNGFFPGENLIITFETTKRPLNLSDVNLIIKHYFL